VGKKRGMTSHRTDEAVVPDFRDLFEKPL